MNTAIIIQARMGSSRYPGKMLAPLAGKPVIAHVVDRALEAKNAASVTVATTTDPTDDPLASFLRFHYGARISVFRGVVHNVLHRFYHAVPANTDLVVRLTGDCPLVDPRLIDDCIAEVMHDGLTYRGITNSPDGTDVEVFTYEALRAAYNFASGDEIEHVTTWIRANRECRSTESHPDLSDVRYSVNTIDDLRLCEDLVHVCGEAARWPDHVAEARRVHAFL